MRQYATNQKRRSVTRRDNISNNPSPKHCTLTVGNRKLAAGDREARRCLGLRAAAQALDRGADVRVARALPPARQGLREPGCECPRLPLPPHDPAHAAPARKSLTSLLILPGGLLGQHGQEFADPVAVAEADEPRDRSTRSGAGPTAAAARWTRLRRAGRQVGRRPCSTRSREVTRSRKSPPPTGRRWRRCSAPTRATGSTRNGSRSAT
jgi:hypothetical protein